MCVTEVTEALRRHYNFLINDQKDANERDAKTGG